MILLILTSVLVLAFVLGNLHARASGSSFPRMLRAGGAGLWAFLVRWQEHSGWGPLCVAAALLAWVVLGALERTAAVDLLQPLGMAPVRGVYALLALGFALLAVKRRRRKLTDDEQKEFWDLLLRSGWGDGAQVVYLGELVFSLVVIALLLYHFRVPA